MTVWDVTRLPERDQFAYWHEVICQAFVPLTPRRQRSTAGFAARVETRPLAGVNRARIFSQPHATHHGPREVAATDGAYYFVNLQRAGRCHARQGTEESVVEPGQFVVVDTTRAFYLTSMPSGRCCPSECPTSSCFPAWPDGCRGLESA